MLQKVLENLKIATLNEMQLATIEAAKKSNDIVLLSPTGSGKTLAFLLPILNSLDKSKEGIQALVIVPSRELAIQIEQVFKQMQTGFKVNCTYGGHSTKTEKNSLGEAPALLIGTPGRLAFHIRNKNIHTATITSLVLDEFDKALEFGFQEDMSFIIYYLKNLQKRMLTSATKMNSIPDFAGLKDPFEINFLSKTPVKAEGLKLKIVKAETKDKIDALFSLICKLGNTATLVFCNHRDAVDRISTLLLEKGLFHGTFHGKMEQEDRERALIKFRNGTCHTLICTDLGSRGLDIPEIQHVVHFQYPNSKEAFIHRNGRTARMKANGSSYLLINSDEETPEYIEVPEIEYTISNQNSIPKESEWTTLYFSGGKKDKISKIDIVGFLGQKGGLKKEAIGLITIMDFSSFVAVKRKNARALLNVITKEKIKGKKLKIAIAK